MKKILSVICFIILLAVLFCSTVTAETSNSFTHIEQAGGVQSTVLSREMYTPEYYITASDLGLEDSFQGLSDVCFGNGGEIYLLCSSLSKLIILNSDCTLRKQMTLNGKDGSVDFSGAKGIFVDDSNKIYICDTNNARVLIADQSGEVKDTWTLPSSDLIPADFVFQPTSLVRDHRNNTYIISQGCYYGALSYAPDGEFKGFYGANTVDSTALDTLEYIWDKLTGSDTKRAASVKKLPYSFVDFSMDADGYMVVCTGATESNTNGKGQIRKISPGGSDILYSNSKSGDSLSSSVINFLEEKIVQKGITYYPQNVISVAVDESDFIYALDQTLGLIYVYDDSCNMLGAFGGGFGTGNKVGYFDLAESIAVKGDRLLVADSATASVTVFKATEYGKLLKDAHELYLQGNYKQAEPQWNRILTLDSGNQMAYKGLAMVKYYNGEYKEAIELAKKGLDYSVYDYAYREISKSFIKKNFGIIALFTVGISGALIYLFVYLKKHRKKLITNPTVATMSGVVFHPFRSYNEVKYKGMGSVGLASVLVMIFFLTSMLNDTFSGFLFSTYSPENYNVFFTLAKTVGLILLWSVANSLVTTLLGGKGNLKEIYIASSYSLIPLVFYNIIRLFLSHVLPLSGASFLNGLYTVVLIYTFYLLSVAMMTVHEYGFVKFIATGLLSLFGMLLVIFVLFMIIIQIQQFGIFLVSIFMEVVYR